MQIIAPVGKIKVGEAAEKMRDGERKRLNAQCSKKIGHFLKKQPDSLRRSRRISGWWSGSTWLENQVVRLGLAGALEHNRWCLVLNVEKQMKQ